MNSKNRETERGDVGSSRIFDILGVTIIGLVKREVNEVISKINLT